jgi:hypothetical protein
VTVTVEEYWRKTWTFHPLGEANHVKPKREKAIVPNEEEEVKDSRVKPLARESKPSWRAVTDGEQRLWNGCRLNGVTYWVREEGDDIGSVTD